MASEYESTKQYVISGVTVTSEIIKDELASDGHSRLMVIRSSCPSERWGTRTQDHSYSCESALPDFEARLEDVRRTAADALVRTERGDIPEGGLRVMLVEIFGPRGKKITAAASPFICHPASFICQDMIEALELIPTGEHYYQELPTGLNAIALYAANIKFGEHNIATTVGPLGTPPPGQSYPACLVEGIFFTKR